MTPINTELWRLLNQKGLTAGDAPQSEEPASLWYMDAFQAIATWMASLLFIGFVGALFNDALENIFLTVPLSLMMLAGAFSIFKIASQVITTNIGLVLSLTAQVLLAFIINEHVDKSIFDLTYTALALFALQILLVLTFDNHVHRMMCAFFAACAFAFVMLIHDHYYWVVGPLLMVFCYLKLTEFSSPKWVKTKSAASAGLLAAVLLIQYNLPEMIRITSQHPFHLSSEILNALALFGTVMVINQRTAMSAKAQAFAFFCALILTLFSFQANGLTTGMTIMLVGVYSGQRVIQGLGIANMLMFASMYYFNLDTTLLHKSITLALLGIVLLAGRWFLLQQSQHTNIENKGDNQ